MTLCSAIESITNLGFMRNVVPEDEMTTLTLSGLMNAVTQLNDDELHQPVEVLALLDQNRIDPLFQAQLELEKSTYLFVTTASNNPTVFYAEPMVAGEHGSYLTYAMLKTLGERLHWRDCDDALMIESELTEQRFRVNLSPVGVHGKLIIAKEVQDAALAAVQ